MLLLIALSIFFCFATIYLGIYIFNPKKKPIKNGITAFIIGVFLSLATTFSLMQLYEIEYNYEIVVGTTTGLGQSPKGQTIVIYTYFYKGKKYENDAMKYDFNVIYPNGKYEVRVAKIFPNFSRIDFSKPID